MSLRGIGCAKASPVRLVGVIKAGSSATFGHSWTASKTVSQTTTVTVEPGKVVWIARSAAMRSVGRRPFRHVPADQAAESPGALDQQASGVGPRPDRPVSGELGQWTGPTAGRVTGAQIVVHPGQGGSNLVGEDRSPGTGEEQSAPEGPGMGRPGHRQGRPVLVRDHLP